MIRSVGGVTVQPRHRLSCHCGTVVLELDLPDGIVNPRRCDCSMCRRRSAIVASVALSGIKVIQGAESSKLYLFNACGNGKCFLFAANNVEQYYRDGSGKDLMVKMDEIEDLLQDPGVTWTATKNPNRFTLSTFGCDGIGELSRGRILGDITVERVKDGSFRVLPDYYNFEQHENPNNNLRTGLRNAITERAAERVGSGVSFTIRFEGTYRPTNPLVQKLTAPR